MCVVKLCKHLGVTERGRKNERQRDERDRDGGNLLTYNEIIEKPEALLLKNTGIDFNSRYLFIIIYIMNRCIRLHT